MDFGSMWMELKIYVDGTKLYAGESWVYMDGCLVEEFYVDDLKFHLDGYRAHMDRCQVHVDGS
jgi:hypothetical protein